MNHRDVDTLIGRRFSAKAVLVGAVGEPPAGHGDDADRPVTLWHDGQRIVLRLGDFWRLVEAGLLVER